MFKVTVTLTLKLLTSKSITIIYGSWPFMIQIVNLGEISLKLMTRLFTSDEQTDGRTDRRTDDMRHNIKRPNVLSDV